MKLVIFALLISGIARGDDTPRMELVAPGYVITEPSWVLNRPGKEKLDTFIQGDTRNLYQCEADRKLLQSEPTLTWKGALLLLGGGVALGVTAGVLLGKRL